MPYKNLTFEEATAYLHLAPQDLMKLINRRNIPFEQVRGHYCFRKNELRDWLSKHIIDDTHHAGVDNFHRKVDLKLAEEPDERTHYLTQCLVDEGIHLHLNSRSRSKILAEIASVAFDSHIVTDREEFLKQVEEREELCSTGMGNGVALPHPRVHSPYLIPENALIIARSSNGIPFGAVDFKKTDLFILPCATDDRSHLFLLSRLALMLQKTDLVERLRFADTAEEVREIFDEEEQELIRQLIK